MSPIPAELRSSRSTATSATSATDATTPAQKAAAKVIQMFESKLEARAKMGETELSQFPELGFSYGAFGYVKAHFEAPEQGFTVSAVQEEIGPMITVDWSKPAAGSRAEKLNAIAQKAKDASQFDGEVEPTSTSGTGTLGASCPG